MALHAITVQKLKHTTQNMLNLDASFLTDNHKKNDIMNNIMTTYSILYFYINKKETKLISSYSNSLRLYCSIWDSIKRNNNTHYRECISPNLLTKTLQLLVPKHKIHHVLTVAYDSPLSRHFGIIKRLVRIRTRFTDHHVIPILKTGANHVQYAWQKKVSQIKVLVKYV